MSAQNDDCGERNNTKCDRILSCLPPFSTQETLSFDLLANPDSWSSPRTGESAVATASRLRDEETSSLIQSNHVVDRMCTRFGTTLTSAQLGYCCLDDTFAVAFAGHSWPALQRLDLNHNRIGDVGGVALSHLEAPLIHLDLSNNHLTSVGLVHIADQLTTGSLRSLRQLDLADVELLLPVKVFQKFASAIEKHYFLQMLSLGYETLSGPPSNDGVASPKEWDEMDAVLRYWWQEPSFRCATRRIRFLLRLNYARSALLVSNSKAQNDQNAIDKLCWVQSLFDSQQAHEVVFLLLQAQPCMVTELVSAPPDHDD